MENIKIIGLVEIFETKAPWTYVKIPKKITTNLFGKDTRAFIPITVKLNKTVWDTYLFPYGDGTYFIALKAEIRKKENIQLGEKIKLSFSIKGL